MAGDGAGRRRRRTRSTRGRCSSSRRAPRSPGASSSRPARSACGAAQAALAIEACCDDSAHQQIPPVRALGNEYVARPLPQPLRRASRSRPPWRIIGAVDGTTLTYEPARAGARRRRSASARSRVRRDRPLRREEPGRGPPLLHVRAHDGRRPYDPSTNDPSANPDGRGDAEFVNVVPPARVPRRRYVFFTDPTYPETNLVVVRVKGPKGFSDVNLDCAGALTGWLPVGTSGTYEYTRIDLVPATSSRRATATTAATRSRARARSASRCGAGARRRRARCSRASTRST